MTYKTYLITCYWGEQITTEHKIVAIDIDAAIGDIFNTYGEYPKTYQYKQED